MHFWNQLRTVKTLSPSRKCILRDNMTYDMTLWTTPFLGELN